MQGSPTNSFSKALFIRIDFLKARKVLKGFRETHDAKLARALRIVLWILGLGGIDVTRERRGIETGFETCLSEKKRPKCTTP
ncbi:60S ribosomal protein L21-A [Fusarium oxysporum f. sp. albedinis]|jgi:hypothetical protein|nr:60S ribosomal protein L21-A [Fusarium oxysporum f. sp. albedinis]